MPKLADIAAALEASSTGAALSNPHHFLFLLGTDTNFTPHPTVVDRSYARGETLSYSAQAITALLGETSTPLPKKTAHSYHSPSVDVLNGPDTMAKKVGHRIAHAVFLSLLAVAQGKTTLQIAAHSRGAVEAILLGHELTRIKAALGEKPRPSLFTILTNSPCKLTNAAMAKFYKETAINDALLDSLHARLASLSVNAFLIDPVPGDAPLNMPGVAWHDRRFYHELPFTQHQLLACQDERSRAFYLLVPPGAHALGIPGHHGTASGNAYTQTMDTLPSTVLSIDGAKDTTHVQDLALCKLFYFLNQCTDVITQRADPLSLEHPDLDNVLSAFLREDESGRQKVLLSHYMMAQKKDKAYRYFRQTSYRLLGTALTSTGDRFVHNVPSATVYCDMAKVIPDRDAGFINEEHKKLASTYVKELIGITESAEAIEPTELVLTITRSLDTILKQMSTPGLPTSTPLDDTHVRAFFLDVFANFVDMISQSYLKNHLEPSQKAALMTAIREPFEMFSKYPQDLPLLFNCKEIIQKSIKKTTEAHYQSILDEAAMLDAKILLLTEDPSIFERLYSNVLVQLRDKFPDLIVEATPSIIEHVKRSLDQYYQWIDLNSAPGERQDAMMGDLRQIIAPLSPYFDASDYDIPHYLKRTEQLFEMARDLAGGLGTLQTLVETPFNFAIQELNDKIILLTSRVGLLMAKTPSAALIQLDSTLNPEFYRQIKYQAMSAGMPSPEQREASEQNLALSRAGTELRQSQRKCDELTRTLTAKELEFRQLKSTLAKAQQSLTTTTARVDTLTATNATQESTIKDLEARLSETQEQLAETAATLLRTQQTLQETQLVLATKASESSQQRSELTDTLAVITKRRDDLEGEKDAAARAHEVQLLALKLQLTETLGMLEVKKSELVQLQEILEKTQQALLTNRKDHAQQLHAATISLSMASKRVDDLTEENRVHKQENAVMTTQLTQIQRERDEVLQTLSSQQKTSELTIAALKQSTRSEMSVLAGELEQMRSQLHTAELARTNTQQALESALAERARVESELQQTRQDHLATTQPSSGSITPPIPEPDIMPAPKENTCNDLIDRKLLPLTLSYRQHLYNKARRYIPDLNEHTNTWPQAPHTLKTPEKYEAIRRKFDIINSLQQALKNQQMPATERVTTFTARLQDAQQQELSSHRGSNLTTFGRYCLAALAFVASGVIPGVIALSIYKHKTGRSPLFFARSTGANYISDCHQAERSFVAPG